MRADAGEGRELLLVTRSAELAALLVYPSEYDFGHSKDAARFIVMPALAQAQIWNENRGPIYPDLDRITP